MRLFCRLLHVVFQPIDILFKATQFFAEREDLLIPLATVDIVNRYICLLNTILGEYDFRPAGDYINVALLWPRLQIDRHIVGVEGWLHAATHQSFDALSLSNLLPTRFMLLLLSQLV